MNDEIHEGLMNVKLRNKSVTGKPYELNNLMGNIKVAIEELENVASILDYSYVTIKVRRAENKEDVITFELYIKGVMIGKLSE